MRQRNRQIALTAGTMLLAIVLLATSALAMVTQPASSPHQSAAAFAGAAPDLGPQAFGLLPAIRPADGNGLDFDQPGGPGTRSAVLSNISLAGAHATYTVDMTDAVPITAPVVRLAVAPVTEPVIRDLAARLGMTGPLQVTRDGGQWDYSITATERATGVRLILGSRGSFSYSTPDPGARCGEAVATARIFPTPLSSPVVPATATPPPYGAGTDLCTNRGAAPDEAHAIAAAQDFLTNTGFLPDPSTTMRALPPPSYAPTLRQVQWAAVAPNGGPLVGRDAQMDTVVAVNPDNRVVNASGTTRTPDATSAYPLRPTADLTAALQAGDAYATLTLPTDASGLPIMYPSNDPLAVHVTATALGYALAYTFDARPYLLPVLIYSGTASNAASTAVGGTIGFTAYVDAVAHPAPTAAPVTATTPLPATPDLASLASFIFTPVPLTRDDFDALARTIGYDNATTTVETAPGADPNVMRAKYADGATLGVNFGTDAWGYDSGRPRATGPITIGPNTPAPPSDVALAVVQQFIAAHHVNLDMLGPPIVTQPLPFSIDTYVCYPLLLNTMPVISPYGGNNDCGISASVESGSPNPFSLRANALLFALQRNGVAGIQLAPPTGSGVIPPQQALDALALAPPMLLNADPSVPQSLLGRLYVTDDPENAVHRQGNTTSLALTRGQAAPNQFTVTSIGLAYIRTSVRTSAGQGPADQLQPVWRIAGQLDSGDRHRIAPFVYLVPATR